MGAELVGQRRQRLLAGQRAGQRAQPLQLDGQERRSDLVLGPEVVVERRLGDAGRRGDRLHRAAPEAVLGEGAGGAGQQAGAGAAHRVARPGVGARKVLRTTRDSRDGGDRREHDPCLAPPRPEVKDRGGRVAAQPESTVFGSGLRCVQREEGAS